MVIYRRREKYPIQTMCQFFDVSRSGYYGFVKRMEKAGRDEPLASLIEECRQQTHQTYGYRRVHIWLERRGIHHDPKTILRVMNKYSLLSEIRRRKRYRIMGQQLHKYANIFNRDFTAERPNQKWVTDISYIHTAQGVLYLSVIRDLFDNSIVAHRTGTEQTVNLVLNTIKDAKANVKAAAELHLHSDQGFQYTSHGYFTLTKEYGIIPSMSRRGNCYDNAMAENFFSILKAECIYRQKLDTYDQARLLIDQYIHFYNYERVQLKTRLTPFEKRSQAA
jgi:Transposase and inactivated derivatives